MMFFLTLGKYYYLENNFYKQATLNNYDSNVDYYLNEKDYLIKVLLIILINQQYQLMIRKIIIIILLNHT